MSLYLIFFISVYLLTRKYNSYLLRIVLMFYIVAATCSLYTHLFITPEAYCTFSSIIFHLFTLYLFIFPIIAYSKQDRTRSIILLKPTAFKVLTYFCISLQIFSIAYFIPYDLKIFFSGDLGALRSALTNGEIDTLSGGGILRTIAGVASYYYCISIILFFYSIAFLKNSRRLNALLLISSLSRIFQSFSYVGRDGIIFWIFSFAFSYCIFKPYLSDENNKRIKSVFIGCGGFAIILLGAISLSRFSGTDKGVINWLIDYFGQPLNNFGQLFDKFHEYTGNSSIWPWFYGNKGARGADAVKASAEFYNIYGFNSNIFFSYIGSFYKAYGPVLTLFLSIIFSIYFSLKLQKKRIGMVEFLMLMFVGQIIWNCYFYYMFANRVGNLFIVSLVIIGMYCRLNYSRLIIISPSTEKANNI